MAHECLEERGLTDKRPIIADRDFFTGLVPLPRFRPGVAGHRRKQETQMVTGDLNAALVEWVVQYRISDPVKFLFDVREPRGTLRDVSESLRASSLFGEC
jgi:membrane protease subunit HflK